MEVFSMFFEKISKNEWIKYVETNMKGAPQEAMDEIIAKWDNIKIPRRATRGSAGYDFYAPMDILLMPGITAIIPTGIKVNLEGDAPFGTVSNETFVLQIYPRSSYGFKYKMHLSNTVGIIDADYYNNKKNEGHIIISCTNGLTFDGCPLKVTPNLMGPGVTKTIDMEHPETRSRILEIPTGTAFCQGLITRVYLTHDDEPVTETRTGGIGSTSIN